MSTAFVGAHLIIGDGRDFDHGSVKIENGRIAEVRTDGQSISADMTVDLAGRALLPGFMDLHDHMVGGDNQIAHGDEWISFRMSDPLQIATLETVAAARRTLQAGVTSAREIGARDYIDVALKKAQARGEIEAPRLIAAGPGVWMTGGHGSFWRPGVGADGAGAIIHRVREMVANGCDVIKTVSSDGPETCGNWDSPQYTRAEVAAAFAEAKRLGRQPAAHAMGNDGINNVVLSGVGTVEHGWYLTEENCHNMVTKGTYLIPTLGNVIDILRKGPSLGMSWAEMMAEDEEAIFARHRMAVELGVNIAMGSDCGGNEARLHGDNLLELECHVRAGMTPMQAIVSGTLEPAKAMNVTDEIGTIETGKLADLVVIDGDPTSDITLTRTALVGVVQGGAVKRDDLGLLSGLAIDPGSRSNEVVLLRKQGKLS